MEWERDPKMAVADMMSFEDAAMGSTVAFKKYSCSFDGRDEGCCSITSSSPMENAKKFCRDHAKWELVDYESLPHFLKHNEFILNYYRSEWPLKETILSIFSIHNETLNVWTHLIGFFIFLALTICTCMMIPRDLNFTTSKFSMFNTSDFQKFTAADQLDAIFPSSDMIPSLSGWHHSGLQVHSICLPERFSGQANHTDPCVLTIVKDDATNMIAPLLSQPAITRWPFFAFLCGAMLCLLISSSCHLLSCHSEHLCYAMLRLDYTGISALIVTSFYPLVYYAFMCQPFYYNLYITFITIFGLATVLFSLIPVFETPEFRVVRAGLFFCMGMSGLVPIIHKLMLFNDKPEAVVTTGYELLMGGFYAVGVVVYTTRVPERWMPGVFDLVGHSHQLFHVLVIAGVYTQYLAGLVYLQWRDLERC